jgi:hypothetical protein
MNEDSLLRAADANTLLASATMGGSCTHLDQSWDWLSAQRRNDLCVEASSPILLFFILGGEPFHDGLWCCGGSEGGPVLANRIFDRYPALQRECRYQQLLESGCMHFLWEMVMKSQLH